MLLRHCSAIQSHSLRYFIFFFGSKNFGALMSSSRVDHKVSNLQQWLENFTLNCCIIMVVRLLPKYLLNHRLEFEIITVRELWSFEANVDHAVIFQLVHTRWYLVELSVSFVFDISRHKSTTSQRSYAGVWLVWSAKRHPDVMLKLHEIDCFDIIIRLLLFAAFDSCSSDCRTIGEVVANILERACLVQH